MENFIFPRKPVCSVYIYVGIYTCMNIYMYICADVHNSGVHGRLFGLDLKGNGHLGKQPMEVTRLVDNVENDVHLKSKGKKTGYTCYLHGQ